MSHVINSLAVVLSQSDKEKESSEEIASLIGEEMNSYFNSSFVTSVANNVYFVHFTTDYIKIGIL